MLEMDEFGRIRQQGSQEEGTALLEKIKGREALSFIAAVEVGRQTSSRSAALVASILASLVGCLIYTGAQLVAPYALFGQLVHYPFLHEDFTNSGIPTIRQYLLSDKGYWGVVGTTVGMLQYSLPFSAILGGVLGFAGGQIGLVRRPK